MSKLSAVTKPNPGNRIEVLPHVGTLRLSGTSSQITSRSAIAKHSGTTSCGALFNDFISQTQISADHQLLVIVHNNIMRGLISNTQLLGKPFAYICQDESVSEFYQPSSQLSIRWMESLPNDLRPVASQQHISHHPWVDLIPSAQFRDNVLRLMTQTWQNNPDKEQELCEDITGVGNLQLCRGRPGMMIWGENSWDVRNWEVTDEFLKQWPSVLAGCEDLFAATDFWRRSRGESGLASLSLRIGQS